MLGVQHLRVELDAVEPAAPDPRTRAIGVVREEAVTRAPSGGAVTESPWLIHPTCSAGRPPKSSLSGSTRTSARPNSAPPVRSTLAAEVAGHELHAVADAENGDAQLEDAGVGVGRALRVDRRRPAGEDERQRAPRRDRRRRRGVVDELRVDAALAHAPGDQLRVLAAEVDDEDGTLLGRRLGDGERDDLAHSAGRACSSALP